MGYADQKFYARDLSEVTVSALATGTTTASGTSTLTAAWPVKKYKRRTAINVVRVYTVSAPAANAAATQLIILNGTNTIATVAPSATAGNWADGTQSANVTSTTTQTTTLPNGSTAVSTVTTTVTQSVIGTDANPSVTVIATGTASAQSYGAYRLFFEEQEQP